jgi:hypothetical protein
MPFEEHLGVFRGQTILRAAYGFHTYQVSHNQLVIRVWVTSPIYRAFTDKTLALTDSHLIELLNLVSGRRFQVSSISFHPNAAQNYARLANQLLNEEPPYGLQK